MRTMTRQPWRFGFFFGLAMVLATADTASCAEVDGRPNVLFIAVDDLNDWVGCLDGYAGVRTPNIDRLAARGMLFANAHCPAPVCNASRTAVLTGLAPWRTGIYNNAAWWRPVLPKVVTLPERFKAAGYLVAGGGKVYHHTPGFNPPDQWHEYFDQVFDDPWHRPKTGDVRPIRSVHWPPGFPLNGLDGVTELPRPVNPMEFDWGPLDQGELEMGDGQMMDWACRFLRQRHHHQKPFFLAVGTFRPHLPWYAPRAHFDRYAIEAIHLPPVKADDLDDVPAMGRKFATARRSDITLVKHTGKWREAIRAYLACISYADALIGRLVDALDASGEAERTIIVLWSDHGWHLGEKGHWHKMTLWERATRVPLVVVAPGVTRAGSRCARPVSLLDLYPTLTELCGLEPSERIDGESLLPLLKDPEAPRRRPAVTTYLRGNHAVRDGRWRYIRYADGGEELYDHRTDPNEWSNVAGDPRYGPIKARLAQWLPERDAANAPGKSAFEFDPNTYRWRRKNPKQ